MFAGDIEFSAWVRIRLLDTKARMGVSRSGTWDYTNGGPISSLGTAAGVYLFGEFRAKLILGMGGRGTPAELAACIRTWQWVATILGSPPELIGRSIAEQRFLDVKIGTWVLKPGENSRLLTRSALNGVATMMFARRIPKPMHEALGRYAMRVALRDSPLEREGINLTDELGYPVHPVLERIVGVLVAAQPPRHSILPNPCRCRPRRNSIRKPHRQSPRTRACWPGGRLHDSDALKTTAVH